MDLKQFIYEYQRCPLCDNDLLITSTQADKIIISNNKLTIRYKTDYFIDSKTDIHQFSISIIDGRIMHDSSTDVFTSLYELDIILEKTCKNCNQPLETFSRSINIFYDRPYSAFNTQSLLEYFKFYYNNKYYTVVNNFSNKTSFIVCDDKKIDIQYIPFEKLNFQDKDKLFSKINSILLLR
jgi:uncharacterized protein with PIN domain